MLRSPVGVFQFEGDFAHSMLRQYVPHSIFDMSLITAALRPSGASYRDDLMQHKPHKNPSAIIDDLLKDNNGYLIYQEDVIKFLQQICGFSGSDADNTRRAIGRKDEERLKKALPQILEGYCEKSTQPRNIAEQEAKEFLQIIEDASSYMFGYNHSIGYCMIGYLCAYLRYYYPFEFITAYLNNANNEDDIKNGSALAELYGIQIVPPRFGLSKDKYLFDKKSQVIAKGIESIKYMNSTVANELYEISQKHKPNTFMELLCLMAVESSLDTRQRDILIKIDYFRDFGNIPELSRIVSFFSFFKNGTAKRVQKDKLSDEMIKLVSQYGTDKNKDGTSGKSFVITDIGGLLVACEKAVKSLNLPDVDLKNKIQTQLELMGYIDLTTKKPEDRRKLLIKPVILERVGLSESDIYIDNKANLDPVMYNQAYFDLMCEGKQSAQSLYHNLNTLESRAGSQIPFTSINFGTDTSTEGKLVSKWLMAASLDGIGKYHLTPIFPISIFKYKSGVNAHNGDPNYDIKKLAIKSLSRRIYPNIVNCNFSGNIEEPGNPDTEMATMGCRTMMGYDRNGLGYSKLGRGNVCPTTINLPKLGIKHGICLGERDTADLDGFWEELDEVLHLTEMSLVDRFYHVCKQSVASAKFMYGNGTIADYDKASYKGIYEAMKHGTLAVGYIGIAEMCQALFGKDHSEDDEVWKFALSVVKHIYDFCVEASEKHGLNFSCYATPAENLCRTYATALKKEFGVIPKVTDREYITNSHHVPVWQKVSIYRKLELEAPFCKYPTGGCITYIELESSIMKNEKAVEDIIDYAMSLDIPYLAFNFPIDSCLKCGYQGEIGYNCPKCGNTEIQRLRRVTGYLTTDYRNFNAGKIKECLDRVKHSNYTDFNQMKDDTE